MKTAASERCRYRAACNDSAKAYNARTGMWHFMLPIRGSFPSLHMRQVMPGRMRVDRWNPRKPYAERKAISPFKGYAPLMDGSRLATPKWLQKRIDRIQASGSGAG